MCCSFPPSTTFLPDTFIFHPSLPRIFPLPCSLTCVHLTSTFLLSSSLFFSLRSALTFLPLLTGSAFTFRANTPSLALGQRHNEVTALKTDGCNLVCSPAICCSQLVANCRASLYYTPVSTWHLIRALNTAGLWRERGGYLHLSHT